MLVIGGKETGDPLGILKNPTHEADALLVAQKISSIEDVEKSFPNVAAVSMVHEDRHHSVLQL